MFIQINHSNRGSRVPAQGSAAWAGFPGRGPKHTGLGDGVSIGLVLWSHGKVLSACFRRAGLWKKEEAEARFEYLGKAMNFITQVPRWEPQRVGDPAESSPEAADLVQCMVSGTPALSRY